MKNEEIENCLLLFNNGLIEESVRLSILTFIDRVASEDDDSIFFNFFYVQFMIYLLSKKEPVIDELEEGDMISDLILNKYCEVKDEIYSIPFKVENYCSVLSQYIIDFPLTVA